MSAPGVLSNLIISYTPVHDDLNRVLIKFHGLAHTKEETEKMLREAQTDTVIREMRMTSTAFEVSKNPHFCVPPLREQYPSEGHLAWDPYLQAAFSEAAMRKKEADRIELARISREKGVRKVEIEEDGPPTDGAVWGL